MTVCIRASPLQREYKQELRISFLPSSRKNPFALLTDSCFIKMADEPVPPRPMLHKLQLCFKQPNRQYSADDWLSLACVSLALYSQFVYCPSLGSRKVFSL